MKRNLPELPAFVRVGVRLRHTCGCGSDLGIYTVVRVGAGRRMAWAEQSQHMGTAIVRARDFREWGDRWAEQPETGK